MKWEFMNKFVSAVIAVSVSALFVAACNSDADVASRNISKAAENFEVSRRIVFYNGITGEYAFMVEGLCALDRAESAKGVTVTCKTGPNQFKKHILYLSDNMTAFAEHLDQSYASVSQYRVTFKPLTIIPDVEIRK